MESGRFRKKKVNFSMISNTIIRDPEISLKAKGLYSLIQSYITLEDFTLYKDFLRSKCRDGEKAFESGWKELKESGYLKQYKMREGSNRFYYEYELLDEPETETNSLHPQNVPPSNVPPSEVPCTKQGLYNNTLLNNTLHTNTNQIISSAEVEEMIRYDTFPAENRIWLNEIVMLITEVLNMPDNGTVRISRNSISATSVKERFRKLNMFHIQYVLVALRQNETEIGNIKNYLLTTLYNAPTTMSTYYKNQMNK
jgi:hypothetical protein